MSDSSSLPVKLSHEVDDQVAAQLEGLNNSMIGTPQFWLILFVIVVFAIFGVWAYNEEYGNRDDDSDNKNNNNQHDNSKPLADKQNSDNIANNV